MKSKHILNTILPLSKQSYTELRKCLRLKDLKWSNFPRELKNAYHNFGELEREMDFEKLIHRGADSNFNYETPI